MSNKDYYKILGVSEGASLDDIKKVYRKLAMKYHPDRNPDNRKEAEQQFKEISEAYYVLGDEKRRQEYDAYRKGYGRVGGDFKGAQGFDFDEILKTFAGFGGRTGRRARSHDSFIFDDMFDVFENMRHAQGEAGAGGTTYYYRTQGPDSGYAGKQNTDITASLPIPANLAQKGGEVLFNYSGKKITLKIKPGTRPGQKLRIKEQGKKCPCCDHRGDLILTITQK
jgi:DnaJ-class molecular chaperone